MDFGGEGDGKERKHCGDVEFCTLQVSFQFSSSCTHSIFSPLSLCGQGPLGLEGLWLPGRSRAALGL